MFSREDIFVVVNHAPQDWHCLVLLIEVLQCTTKADNVGSKDNSKISRGHLVLLLMPGDDVQVTDEVLENLVVVVREACQEV
jgi:hypothetical protein